MRWEGRTWRVHELAAVHAQDVTKWNEGMVSLTWSCHRRRIRQVHARTSVRVTITAGCDETLHAGSSLHRAALRCKACLCASGTAISTEASTAESCSCVTACNDAETKAVEWGKGGRVGQSTWWCREGGRQACPATASREATALISPRRRRWRRNAWR